MCDMLDVLLDALVDTIKLVPFLFLTYLLMEWLEHKTSDRTRNAIRNAGMAGPVFGGILGVLPQCGFSTAASNLYAGRVITLGTLIAVFLSTSDEMLPIMISEKVPVSLLLLILGLKAAIGIASGLVVDFAVRHTGRVRKIQVGINDMCRHDHCHCEKKNIVRSALKHTLVITAFIFAITLVLNLMIHYLGEEAIASFILKAPYLGPVIAGLVGLIPNCAASVVITQLYLGGLISFGSMMAGLLAGSGVGLMVLFKVNENRMDSVRVAALVYVIGVASGVLMDIIW
jgi:hypothetical protein